MGFMGVCCNWCCLVTGGFGVLFLGFLACTFYFSLYFEPDINLGFSDQPDKIKEEHEHQAIGLMFGVIVELIVFIVSLCVLIAKSKKKQK